MVRVVGVWAPSGLRGMAAALALCVPRVLRAPLSLLIQYLDSMRAAALSPASCSDEHKDEDCRWAGGEEWEAFE
jgi:hypothetical protein